MGTQQQMAQMNPQQLAQMQMMMQGQTAPGQMGQQMPGQQMPGMPGGQPGMQRQPDAAGQGGAQFNDLVSAFQQKASVSGVSTGGPTANPGGAPPQQAPNSAGNPFDMFG